VRHRKVSKKRFLALSRELHALARSVGADLKVHWRPVNWDAVRNGLQKPFGCVGGYYDMQDKRCVVTVYGRKSRWMVLHTMAHEVRHAIQHAEGLFAEHWRKEDVKRMWKWATSKRFTQPPNCARLDPRVGWLMERDADKWAAKWLTARGVDYDEQRLFHHYSGKSGYRQTMSWQLGREMDNKVGVLKLMAQAAKQRRSGCGKRAR
jgi:hypothetical protein